MQLACLLEVSAAKPGNITPAHDFSDTTYADMVRSALALGPVFARRRARARSVGELIADGVDATARVAGANTNLGIVLLFAPLVRAAVDAAEPARPLRAAIERTLAAARRRRRRRGVRGDRPGQSRRPGRGARARRQGSGPGLAARGDGGRRAPRQHRLGVRNRLRDRVRHRRCRCWPRRCATALRRSTRSCHFTSACSRPAPTP